MRLLTVLLLSLFGIGFCYSETTKFNILYLNSYNIGYAWSDSITQGIQKALMDKDVSLYIECIDAKRFGQTSFDSFADYLQKKYKNIKFDAAIVSDNDALEFALLKGDQLFPEIPVTFCGINNPEDYNFNNSRFYGFIESAIPFEELLVFQKLVPNSKSLLLLTDNTTSGEIMEKEKNSFQKNHPAIKINFINEIDQKEVLNIVASGKMGDFVYLNRVNRDKYGNLIDYKSFAQKLGQISPRPVFCDDEAVIGNGLVGGNANRGYTQGYNSAILALQLLDKKVLKSFAHINQVEDEYIFDYKVIKKLNINTAFLPHNTILINKPFIHNLRFIVGLLTIILILTAVIVFLGLNVQMRKKAERKVKEQLVEINEQNNKLQVSHSQLNEMNCELEEANAQLSAMNTSLQLAKNKAEESERLKSSFLANLSHEIRTPLNAILGFSFLLDNNLTEDKKDKYLNIIQSSSEYLLALIDDILDFSKIEAGQVQIQCETIVVNEVLTDLISSFQGKNSNPEVQLVISDFINTHPVKLITDKVRFNQILNNLITNAIKFTEKGRIEIGYLFSTHKEIIFYVKDSGIGIARENHAAIFERFRKIEDKSDKLYSGSGLGLAICKRLIDLLEGEIWVESELNQGATFYFSHPNYTLINPEQMPPVLSTVKTNYNWKGKLIVIAEDEDTNYFLVEHILRKEGAEVIRFRDGLSLIEYIDQQTPHHISLILMDIKMPGMNGFEALQKVREKYPTMIIIAQSAYAMPEDISAYRRNGFSDYITKPIKLDLFRQTIDRYLS